MADPNGFASVETFVIEFQQRKLTIAKCTCYDSCAYLCNLMRNMYTAIGNIGLLIVLSRQHVMPNPIAVLLGDEL